MRRMVSSVLGVGLIFGSLACGNSALDIEDRLLAAKPIQPKNPDPARLSQATGNKLDPYITCINTVFRGVNNSRNRYLSWIKDTKVGPTCKERNIYAPYRLLRTANCTTALERANKLMPKMPALESAATELAKAIRKLEPLIKEANRYYSGKSYQADSCKKGQALHPRLMAGFAIYAKTRSKMSAVVNTHNQKVLRELLVSIEKKFGKNHPRYFHRKVSLDARAVLTLMRAQTFDKNNKPGMPKIRSAVSALAALMARMDGAPNKFRAGAGYISFRLTAKRFMDGCKEYVSKRATGTPKYTRMERRWLKKASTSWLVKGSYARVDRRFGELIRKSNAVKFR